MNRKETDCAAGFFATLWTFLLAFALLFSWTMPSSSAFGAEVSDGVLAILSGEERAGAADGGSDSDDTSEWDISAEQDGSVIASVVPNQNGSAYTLLLQGSGTAEEFDSAQDAPWYSKYGNLISAAEIEDGITAIGSYTFSLPKLVSLRGGEGLASIGSSVFDGASMLVGIDLSTCTISEVAIDAFGASATMAGVKRTIYVKDASSAAAFKQLDAEVQSSTAIAVMNGGILPKDTVFQSELLATPKREGYSFVTWTTDAALMWPELYWKPMTLNYFYAKFAERAVIEDPEPYAGFQGFDQKVKLLNLSALPYIETNTDVMFYGETDDCYDNRFVDTKPFNEAEDIVFAFTIWRGTNANGGNGDYQMSFVLPYISIVDASGNTVATYDDGKGLLRKYSILFDGVEGKTVGNTIYAIRIGVDAHTLGAGQYTLRFGKGLGANNGISFLGKDVDFRFTVAEVAKYELKYSFDASGTASVSGIEVFDNSPLDIEIPLATVNPATGATCSITSIADSAFSGVANIRSVDIPSTVKDVGSAAFSDMESLEWVKILAQGNSSIPAWGSNVFDGSHDCLVYGYSSSSVQAAVRLYENAQYHPLESGIYADCVVVSNGDTVKINAQSPVVTFRVISNGTFSTASYCSYITDTYVVSHANTGPYGWNVLTGLANGRAQMEIRTSTATLQDAPLITVEIECSGFELDAVAKKVPVTAYQGNGTTIALQGAGTVLNVAYDETLDYYDNYIQSGIPIEGGLFTFDLTGPGAAWGPEHGGWNWDKFVSNVNAYIWVQDEAGRKVAAPGSGLTLTRLVQSPSTVQFTIDGGVLVAGKTYTLVVDKDMTGHNVASTIMKSVHWTFAATKADINSSNYNISGPPSRMLWTGEEIEPEISVSAAVPETSIWDETTLKQVVTPATTRLLKEGADYTVTYENNVEMSAPDNPAVVVIEGIGNYSGTVRRTFIISDTLEEPVVPLEMQRMYNPNSGEHFYTASTFERDSLIASGWLYEGVGWIAPETSSTPVYRLYSGTDHHYTTSEFEKDALVQAGWVYEGIGWYSDDAQGVPLYRQFNPFVDPGAPTNNSGSHNYTTNAAEEAFLVNAGWLAEGIAWYGMQ